MTTTTKTRPDLDAVIAAVADAGYPLTQAEADVARRRLARNGKFRGRPDPLSGTETDPVAAVDHLYDERGGPLARSVEGPPPVASLIDGYEPERGDESLADEVERLRAENEALRVGGPGHLARVEQVQAASAGPTDTSGNEVPSPATEVEPKAEPKGAKP